MAEDLDDRSSRDPTLPPGGENWSDATWSWIAGIAILLLVLIFAFGRGEDEVAMRTQAPSATTGQRSPPPPPPTGPKSDAPTMNRPALDSGQQPPALETR